MKNLHKANLVGNPARDSFVIYEQEDDRNQESRLQKPQDRLEASTKEAEIEEDIQVEESTKLDGPDVSAEKVIESMEQSKAKEAKQKTEMAIDTALNYNHQDDEILSEQLSPKQVRNEANSSIANRRKLQQVGFLSNDQVLPPQYEPEEEELQKLK